MACAPPPCMAFSMDQPSTNTIPFEDEEFYKSHDASLVSHDVPLDGDSSAVHFPQDENEHHSFVTMKSKWFSSFFSRHSNYNGNTRELSNEITPFFTRNRIIYGLFIAIFLSLISSAVYISLELTSPPRGNAMNFNNINNIPTIGQEVSFYLISNTPHNAEEGQTLNSQLQYLGSMENESEPIGSFVVHLGDVQNSYSEEWSRFQYQRAKDTLLTCPIPVFILPGNNDWNDSPSPLMAWMEWKHTFNHFENQFDTNIPNVKYQVERNENFSFVYNGVLFIGIHLVDGDVPNSQEWKQRINEDVEWTQNNLSKYNKNDYRAVVLMGHAPPIRKLDGYFLLVVDYWKELQSERGTEIPLLYAFANKISPDLYAYTPTHWNVGKYPMLTVENTRGGHAWNGVTKVIVKFGMEPFVFESLGVKTE